MSTTLDQLQERLATLMQKRAGYTKAAADGFNSAGPIPASEQLPGDDPEEGFFAKENADDMKDTDSNVAEGYDASMTEDSQSDTGMDDSIDIGSVDSLESPDISEDVEDPGTSYSASTDNAEKYASFSLEENIASFSKKASAILAELDGAQPYYNNQRGYARQKQASADVVTDRVSKLAAVTNMANEDAYYTAQYLNKLAEDASGCAGGNCEGGECVNGECVPGEAPVASPEEEAAVQEILAQLPPETQEEVLQLAAAIESGEIPPEVVEEMASKSASYQRARVKLAAELDNAAAELPEGTPEKLNELSDEDLAAVAAESEAGSLSEDEIVDAIVQGLESGEITEEELDAALAEEGMAEDGIPADGPAPEEEAAVAELSNAMADQGVTPEDLEAITDPNPEKQAAAHKIAEMVRWHRTPKTKKQADYRTECSKVLNELFPTR